MGFNPSYKENFNVNETDNKFISSSKKDPNFDNNGLNHYVHNELHKDPDAAFRINANTV